jgi:hypothetical protein
LFSGGSVKKGKEAERVAISSEKFDAMMRGAFKAPKPYPKKAKGKRPKKSHKKG